MLYVRQQKRHRCKKQAFGLFGRRWEWDDMREKHWNMYITICKTDDQYKSNAWSRAPKGGALGQPRRMEWEGGGRGFHDWGTNVHPWLIHVQFSSVAQSCPTLCDPMNCSTPGHPVHHQLPEFTQTHVHQVGDAIQPSHPLSSLFLLPPIPPSIRVFSNESTLHMRWLKYWSFSFSISPSNEHPGLISFRLDLLAVQGTLKHLLQHHSSKASVLRCSAFFRVQLSHPYMTTGKTIALTRRTFVGKIMSLLFNMLSRLVITFLPRSKRLLISWLQLPSTCWRMAKTTTSGKEISPPIKIN